jgi:hypothetical protein
MQHFATLLRDRSLLFVRQSPECSVTFQTAHSRDASPAHLIGDLSQTRCAIRPDLVEDRRKVVRSLCGAGLHGFVAAPTIRWLALYSLAMGGVTLPSP